MHTCFQLSHVLEQGKGEHAPEGALNERREHAPEDALPPCPSVSLAIRLQAVGEGVHGRFSKLQPCRLTRRARSLRALPLSQVTENELDRETHE